MAYGPKKLLLRITGYPKLQGKTSRPLGWESTAGTVGLLLNLFNNDDVDVCVEVWCTHTRHIK